MQPPSTWLTKLKAAELHKLAVRIGSPCSGTKAVQIKGIQDALLAVPKATTQRAGGKAGTQNRLSLISVDMGIRNLAYSHWTSSLEASTELEPMQYARPVLQAWRKIDVSSSATTKVDSIDLNPSDANATNDAVVESAILKESFEPIEYANHAHNFIEAILKEHEPTHVLIERQRFRSGGNSTVLEWTIRVGVFEGMLYAVLKSLGQDSSQVRGLGVEPILPARVNRYWLEGLDGGNNVTLQKPKLKSKARDVKQAKIELVRQLLTSTMSEGGRALFTAGEGVGSMVSAFIDSKTALASNVSKHQPKTSVGSGQLQSRPSKLDDLSDCLLQGLAWIHWQNNRLELASQKQDSRLLGM